MSLDAWCNNWDCKRIAILPSRYGQRFWLFEEGSKRSLDIDAVFPVLHGKNGEDGTVQGLLSLLNIPVVGCGILSSALCMDKDRAHRIVKATGISVPKSFVISRSTDDKVAKIQAEKIGYPLFVKPVKAGSSYGVAKVFDEKEFVAAIGVAFQYDENIIVEESIKGFEVGCAVLGNEELTIGEIDEIELSDGFFDYEEKYTLKNSAIYVPARVPEETARKIKRAAASIYKTLDCKGFARVDLFLSDSLEIVFNEVNTIPGFTAHSRFPNMLKAAGMNLTEVISAVIELALN